MKKAIAAILTAVLLLSTLAACGDSSSSQGSSTQSSSATQSQSTSSQSENENALADQPFITLEVYAVTFGSNLDSLDAVNAAVNEYIKPILNMEVNLHILDYGSYGQQMNLMMTGAEPVDLMISTGATTTSMYAQGALQPIGEAVEKFGAAIIEQQGYELLNACRYDGEYYAVPSGTKDARVNGFIYSKAINDQYSLGLEKAKTMADVEAALAKLKEEAPEMIGVFANNTQTQFALWSWDDVGNKFGVLMDGGATLQLENLYATDEYRELCEMARRWYQEGYIYSEAATSAITFADMFMTGNVLGQVSGLSAGSDVQHSLMFGTEINHIELTEPFLSTAAVQQSVWVVPHNATDVDRSIQFVNLMYADPALSNLLTYGIEGENYQVIDEANGVIDYVAGQDSSSKTWDNSLGWVWGPATIRYIWSGQPLNIRELTLELQRGAKVSKAMGFTFDPSSVENEITACTNVQSRYALGLECGALDPDTVLPEFIAALEAAGIDTIMTEKQRQLDEWAAANGVG